MAEDTKKRRYRKVLRLFLVIGALTLILMGYRFLIRQRITVTAIPNENGLVDVRDFDFREQVAMIDNSWEFYPEELFSSLDACDEERRQELRAKQGPWKDTIPYGTYRLVIFAKPKQYLSLNCYSLEYGTCVFVNGVKVGEIGVVADNPEKAVPCANNLVTNFYTGDDGRVELIYQYSNFVHKEGGSQRTTYLSTYENVGELIKTEMIPVYVISGGLLLVAAYYLMQAAIKQSRASFMLALACLILSLRDQRFYLASLLSMNYDWTLHYRISVLFVGLIPPCIFLLCSSLYRGVVRRWLTVIYEVMVCVGAAVFFLIDTRQVVTYSYIYGMLSIPYLLVIIVSLIQYWRKTRPERTDYLLAVGFLALIWSYSVEVLSIRVVLSVSQGGYTRLAMVFFVMDVMMVLAIREEKAEQALMKSRESEQLLIQQNVLKNEFLHNISHELKTPLTVMSGYAQLTRWQLAEGRNDNLTIEHLAIISEEAKRLSKLVSQSLIATEGETQYEKLKLDIGTELNKATQIIEPIAEKNGNRVEVILRDEPIFGYFHAGLLRQILLNLGYNANKHTSHGTISFEANNNGGGVDIRISDTGDGIAKDIQEHIFERGVTTGDGYGLGLSICRTILDGNGGSIALEKTSSKGTTFIVSIPLVKEMEKGGNREDEHNTSC